MSDEPALFLFDDERARGWQPFARTRPVGECLFGCLLLRERAERFWKVPCVGHLTSPALAGFREEGSPPVVEPGEVDEDRTRILLSSRAAPDLDRSAGPPDPSEPEDGPALLTVDSQPAGWILPPGVPLPEAEALASPEDPEPEEDRPRVEIPGEVLGHPWDLMARNPERIRRDVRDLFPGDDAFLPPGVERLGSHPVSLGHDVVVESGVILDVRQGPIRLGEEVEIRAPARLVGPLFLGPGTVVFGGHLEAVSAGPICKLRGEIDTSVIFGWANKAHDGYLGHAVLGRWVNLGALTTNSDLKNNYGPVRVRTAGGDVDTGLLKVGVFLGDHVKTGIGTLLNTGVVIGAGSNVFGGGMVPGYVPPFSWASPDATTEYRLDRFLEVAERAMGRRDVELDEGMREVLTRAWEESRELRGS